MSPIPRLYLRQAVPVPPPANPYARPGPAQNPAQRPTPYSGGRTDVSKKGAGVWRKFLNWFNDPGLGQDRTAVVIAVVIICLFIIGILAFFFITKKKKLEVASANLTNAQFQLKEAENKEVDHQLEANLHKDPPTKEEDAEKLKIQEAADARVAEFREENERLRAQLDDTRKNVYNSFMQGFRR